MFSTKLHDPKSTRFCITSTPMKYQFTEKETLDSYHGALIQHIQLHRYSIYNFRDKS